MKLRVARHTADLNRIVKFYSELFGLAIIGSFQNHQGYDGVFLGDPAFDWHLEFTSSEEKPAHYSNEEDLLVFYKKSKEEFSAFRELLRELNIEPVKAKNPYWEENGFMFLDPDGYRIVISYEK